MSYNYLKEKGCKKEHSTLSQKEKTAPSKEELKEIKESINNMRSKMCKIAGFDKKKNIVISREALKASQELDVLITKYYQKNKI